MTKRKLQLFSYYSSLGTGPKGRPPLTARIWQIKTDSGSHLVENIANINLQPGKHQNDYNIEPDLLGVGFYQVEALFQFDQGLVVSDQMTIGYQPSSLQTILTRESDFDNFWTDTESKLQQISPAY